MFDILVCKLEEFSDHIEQQDILLNYTMLYICQNQRIRGLLEKCTVDHEIRMEAVQNAMHEKALSDAKWRQIQEDQSVSAVLMTLI